MKKEWFRRNWLWIIVVVGEVILACLIWLSGDWFFGGSRQTFGPLNSYIFIWLSIVIATIAALNSMKASDVASKSLELTRATQRPFLSITSIVHQPPKTVEIIFCNTGALPSDSNTFQAIFSETKDFSEPNDLNKLSHPIIHESPPIFPGEKQQWDIFLTQDRVEYVNSGNEVYLKIDIKYIYNKKEEGITSRVSHLPKSDKERGRVPFSILSEGSYWK